MSPYNIIDTPERALETAEAELVSFGINLYEVPQFAALLFTLKNLNPQMNPPLPAIISPLLEQYRFEELGMITYLSFFPKVSNI